MSVLASIKHIVLSLLFVLATINFTRTTLSAFKSSKRLDDLQQEVKGLEDEKISLQEVVDFKSTTAFIEQEARNKLNLILPGEDVFVVSTGSSGISGAVSTSAIVDSNKTNVQLWVELFL